MLNIGLTKLQLDDAVGGDEAGPTLDEGNDDKQAKAMRKSLLTKLRNKFEEGESVAVINGNGDKKEELEVVKEETDQETPGSAVKKARGGRGSIVA